MAVNIPPETEFVTIPELCERWALSPSRVHRLLEDHHLAGVHIDGILRIPAEFALEDEPLRPLRGTFLALHDAGFSTEEAVGWVLSANEELGERPVDALKHGRKSAVRRATQALAW